MDFMSKYSKSITVSVNNTIDEDPKLSIDNKMDKEPSDNVDIFLKSKENMYQKMLIDTLAQNKSLKVSTVHVEKLTPANTKTKCLLPPNYNSSMTKDEIIKECKDIKDKTCELNKDINCLVNDVSTVKDSTLGSIKSIMEELSKKFQNSNLDNQ
ncbi:core wall protein [Cotia virus SPAn232]|uniref:39kDa core protein OPG130 n=2 Tax=Cotia virus TaxID=39444 RepID=A0A097IVT4_9POXV|nr:core wall protein [Cotia virus SPAn232]AFB76939.1 core wall protein [Cotia virus SPAn232]AIT70727.1 core wall protein [Cotia virus]